ncbi:MAG: AbrB/MazE/SpoVT family DNA-binding domain-containing protein, partial [Candidatus Nanohaloarchaea archaeon]
MDSPSYNTPKYDGGFSMRCFSPQIICKTTSVFNLMPATRKVQEGSNGQILVTIPKDFAEAFELEQGSEVEFKPLSGETLQIKKK